MRKQIGSLLENKSKMDITSTQFMILVYFVYHSPKNELTEVPIGYMASKLGLARNSIQKAVSDLVSKGIFYRELNFADDGAQLPSLYFIRPEYLVDEYTDR